MVASFADRICARAQGRLAREFVSKGCPFLRNTNLSQCDLPVRPPEKDEKWRRVTGMTLVQEPKMDRRERRAGIAKFFAEIEREYVAGTLKTEFGAKPFFSTEFRAAAGVLEDSGDSFLTDGDVDASDSASRLVPQGDDDAGDSDGLGESNGYPLIPRGQTAGLVGLLPSGEKDIVWACEGSGRTVLAAVCLDYNISVAKLNALAREYRGITASELIDGLRVRPVKAAVAELLKVYARGLWLSPGSYANVLVLDKRLRVCSGGAGSNFFVDPDAEWRRSELYELREERWAALLAAYDAGWSRGDQSRDGFAAELGFRGFKELNRACLNVFGQSVRQMAFAILKEIVEFYLAAEVKALRELAGCDSNSHTVMRARYLYRGDCERAVAPFWDFWEANDAAWLAEMGGWLRLG